VALTAAKALLRRKFRRCGELQAMTASSSGLVLKRRFSDPTGFGLSETEL
jgi:hypothetical protein